MRINEGRIGGQEAAAMTGIAVYAATVFTLDSQTAYSGGNATYIWLPVSIALSLAAVLIIMRVMQKKDISTLDMLLKKSFGRLIGGAASAVVILLLVTNAYFIIVDFVNMVHSFVFYDSGYWEIAIWVTVTVFLLSFWGLECISRTALIMLPLLAGVILYTLFLPVQSYSAYRLYPFPGNRLSEILIDMLDGSSRSFGAIAALLCMTNGVHGMKFARKYCIIGTAAATVFVAFTQLCIALTFDYIDLSDMLFPLYRLGMMGIEEGYFFRMDTLLLFFWMMIGVIAAAYFIYAASILWCRAFGPKDTRPAVVALSVTAASAVLLQAEGYFDEAQHFQTLVNELGWCVITLPLAAAVIQLLKRSKGAKV